MQRARDRWGRLLPFLAAFGVWATGSALVLRHVARADDFVMAEVRRHGLVSDLVRAMLPFLVVYGVVAALAVFLVRRLARPLRVEGEEGGLREGVAATLVFVALLAGSTVEGMRELPAVFAGLFYEKGGVPRAIQLAVERWLPVEPAAFRPPASTSSPPTRPDASTRPNVLMIVVDSLRPDRVFGEAGHAPVAPRLGALADASAAFTNASTPIARTYGSMTSLLTGQHPARHGVRTLYPEREARVLATAALPARLAGAGYETIAVGGYCATVLREVSFGFGVQRTPTSEIGLVVALAALRAHPLMTVWLRGPLLRELFPLMRNAVEGERPDDVADEAIAAWRKTRGPFFEVVFFGNAHQPYSPVAPEAMAAGSYRGPNRYTLTAGDLVEQVRVGETGGAIRGDAGERANLLRLYDGAVHGVDRAVGRLLDALEADGLSGDTMVIALADHGENLMDGGGPMAHGEAVEQDRSNAVPLSWRLPGRIAPRRIEEPVSVMDVAPTIAEATGLPPEASDGISLWPVLVGNAGHGERSFLLETCIWFFAKDQVARLDPSGRGLSYPDFTKGLLEVEPGTPPHIVVAPAWREPVLRAKERRLDRGAWSLTYLPRDDGGSLRLYDRRSDPWLTHDISAVRPDVYEEMTRAFYAEVTRLGDPTVLPPEPGAAPAR
jgi:arylsulfatase A-like enzyme